MISSNALFIVGAGSSHEYGHPIWSDLKNSISQFLEQKDFKNDVLAKEAKEWLKDVSPTKTLDQVISERNKAIRMEIDPSEVEALIWRSIATLFAELEKKVIAEKKTGWIDRFVDWALDNITSSYAATDINWNEKLLQAVRNVFGSMYFITFNYDRLLEYKIWNSIFTRLRSDINNDTLFTSMIYDSLLDRFKNKFYHPHGILHPYPNLDNNSDITKKRNTLATDRFGDISKNSISLSGGLMASCFDCDNNSSTYLKIIKNNFSPYVLYLLGNSPYGLDNNLKKLPCEDWAEILNKVVCTSFDPKDQELYRKIIREHFGNTVEILFYKTCTEFIDSETGSIPKN